MNLLLTTKGSKKRLKIARYYNTYANIVTNKTTNIDGNNCLELKMIFIILHGAPEQDEIDKDKEHVR